MKISRTHWTIFILLAALSLGAWFRISYPRLAIINLSIKRQQAMKIAGNYLTRNGYDASRYLSAAVFTIDTASDKYLQRNLGFEKLVAFTKEHDFNFFFWLVRFYKENQKEEFRVSIDAGTGQITSYKHIIDDTAARPKMTKEEAEKAVRELLEDNFHIDLDKYTIKGDTTKSYDNREDYSFSWMEKNVAIPWSTEKNSGTAKLVTGATISGHEILTFFKAALTIPEEFYRYLERESETGRNLSLVAQILYIILFVSAVFILISRRNHLVMHTTKRFYVTVTGIIILLSFLSIFNNWQGVMFDCPTTAPIGPHLQRLLIHSIIGILFVSVGILMPALSGELLHYETLPDKKEGAFSHFVRSSFLSRKITGEIILGYLICLIMLGMQSLITHWGQRHWGVWIEYSLLATSSTAYLPFLAAATLGFKASFFEETMYRLFAISWGKKVFKSLVGAAVVSSVIWGLGHSGYPVYPMWFRAVEVSLMGFLASFVYLRFGIIPVLVSHFCFDALWASAGYLFGKSSAFDFYMCIFVLLIPVLYAITAYCFNRSEEEKPMRWLFNKHQIFNLGVLKTFLEAHPELWRGRAPDVVKKEISRHGWDIAVVEQAIGEMNTPPTKQV